MGDRDDMARLMWWDADGQMPRAAYERLESHPRYVEAMRALSARMLKAAHEDKAVDGIAKDVGRYFGALWALYLDSSGGLTLPRLKHLCARTQLLSPGRARALLLYLRYLGYVEPAASQTPGQPTLYIPTRALAAAWKHLLQEALAAVRIVEPAIDVVLSRLDLPDVLRTFVRCQGEGTVVALSSLPTERPFIRIFAHRHGGMQTLHWITCASDRDDDYPAREPVTVPIAALARQLRVSRTHIKRMLRDAEDAGFLIQGSDGQVLFSEAMRLEMRWTFSSVMIAYLICAAKTARAAVAPRRAVALSA